MALIFLPSAARWKVGINKVRVQDRWNLRNGVVREVRWTLGSFSRHSELSLFFSLDKLATCYHHEDERLTELDSRAFVEFIFRRDTLYGAKLFSRRLRSASDVRRTSIGPLIA